MTNVLFKQEYPQQYTSAVQTQVSNALLVGEIFGQIVIGLTCDYMGRKTAIVLTTAMIVIGGILATAAHGTTILGMFWMITVSRGIIGFGTGGEYPASSTSASEAANEYTLKRRGPVFIMVTNFPLSFGTPLAVSIFLIVLAICTTNNLSTVWRVCFGIGCIFPLTVFYFRIKMLNSKLYRRGAIKRRVPYLLVLRYYWRDLIGTCGAWFLYDFVSRGDEPLCRAWPDAASRSPSPTASFLGRSSRRSSRTATSTRLQNISSCSPVSPFPESSSARSCAMSSDARRP
jgi:MFS family permease